MRGMIWFREDLRLDDNLALHYAAKTCDEGLIAIYLIDPTSWKNHDIASCRVDFILRGLKELKEHLNKINIPLLIIHIEHPQTIPEKIFSLMKETKSRILFFNKQYEIDEARRDKQVQMFLDNHEIRVESFDDQVILPPGSVKTQDGSFFKVFTAFKNAWYKTFLQNKIDLLPAPKTQSKPSITSSLIPDHLPGFESTISQKLWIAGESAAKKQLHHFIDQHLFSYDKERDFPSLQGTSKLSPYLASGMVSPRTCFMAALFANKNKLDQGNLGATTWMSELIWREFYKHLIATKPALSMHRAFQPLTEKLKWRFNEEHFLAWQQGQTGFPLIDAAMRQLNQTGWMHNRLRMVVGMFLTKNLFFDWRLGEKYFMNHLIDGDLAANNGGWQWCASTGTDAVPYFRVFNPISQSQKFDPEGTFIRAFCPELKELDNKAIHEPYKYAPLITKQLGYPHPILDLKKTREAAIAAFKALHTRN